MNDDGTYTLVGVPTGTYTIEFSAPFPSGATEYWQDEPTFAAADYFSVTAGDSLTGYDVSQGLGATISGTVTTSGTDPQPLVGSTVSAMSTADPREQRGGDVGDDGTYSIPGLAPGNYTVRFQPPYGDSHASNGGTTLPP